MLKKICISFLLVFSAHLVRAQQGKFKLGLRFAPGLAQTRVQDMNESDSANFSSASPGLRFSAGISGDFYFGRNYAFYTGLWYTVTNSGIKAEFNQGGNVAMAESFVNIQNIQIPVALKLFTNEIATDAKLYFTIGGAGNLAIKKVESRAFTNTGGKFTKTAAPDAYSFGDVGLLLGAGVEYKLGDATALFGGLTYNRGLTGVASKKGPIGFKGKDSGDLYDISLGLICLEMGIYF
jgi:hypothetical protein